MKRSTLPIFLIILMSVCIILGSCDGDTGVSKLPVPELSSLGEELVPVTGIQSPMELTPEEAEMIMGIPQADISQSYIRISEEAIKAEMICVIKCTDEAAAQRVKSALSSYLSHQAATFQSYLPEEYAKLKDVTARSDGLYVYAAIGSDRDGINGIFGKYFN